MPAATGMHVSPQAPGLVRLRHTERSMKIYGVTENELRTLTAINLFMAFAWAVGSAFLGMGVDLHKDLLLAENIPAKAEVLKDMPTALFIGAAIFYIAGTIAFFVRGSFINTIRKETIGQG